MKKAGKVDLNEYPATQDMVGMGKRLKDNQWLHGKMVRIANKYRVKERELEVNAAWPKNIGWTSNMTYYLVQPEEALWEKSVSIYQPTKHSWWIVPKEVRNLSKKGIGIEIVVNVAKTVDVATVDMLMIAMAHEINPEDYGWTATKGGLVWSDKWQVTI